MILCGQCSKSASYSNDVKEFRCQRCNNRRFHTLSISPAICDVCAVGGNECMICRSSIGLDKDSSRKAFDSKFQRDEFHSKIKGVTMENRQDSLKQLIPGQELFYTHEKSNPFDPNAIKLFADKDRTIALGYISKDLSPDLLEYMYLYGVRFSIFVSEVTGGTGEKSLGCNIRIKLHR